MLTWEECELLMSGTHKDFYQVLKGKGDISDSDTLKLQEGDLILRNMHVACSPCYHAGIYCGNEEVIEFTANPQQGGTGFASSSSSSSTVDGGVSKAGLNNFISKKPYVVLRLKNGIPQDFAHRVKRAMKQARKYNLLSNNCLHFALELLGLSTRPLPERQ